MRNDDRDDIPGTLYFARRLLHAVQELEQKLEKLEREDEIPPGLEDDEPWA